MENNGRKNLHFIEIIRKTSLGWCHLYSDIQSRVRSIPSRENSTG